MKTRVSAWPLTAVGLAAVGGALAARGAATSRLASLPREQWAIEAAVPLQWIGGAMMLCAVALAIVIGTRRSN